MIEQLTRLLSVREAHLHSAHVQLTRTAAALAVVERERAALDEELRLIATQRSGWERQWQHWLREDGVLCRGQEYNLLHLRLSAWETDTREQHAEVSERYRVAEDAVVAARASLRKHQLRADRLRRELEAASSKLRSRHSALAASRASDDRVLPGRIASQVLEQV